MSYKFILIFSIGSISATAHAYSLENIAPIENHFSFYSAETVPALAPNYKFRENARILSVHDYVQSQEVGLSSSRSEYEPFVQVVSFSDSAKSVQELDVSSGIQTNLSLNNEAASGSSVILFEQTNNSEMDLQPNVETQMPQDVASRMQMKWSDYVDPYVSPHLNPSMIYTNWARIRPQVDDILEKSREVDELHTFFQNLKKVN